MNSYHLSSEEGDFNVKECFYEPRSPTSSKLELYKMFAIESTFKADNAEIVSDRPCTWIDSRANQHGTNEYRKTRSNQLVVFFMSTEESIANDIWVRRTWFRDWKRRECGAEPMRKLITNINNKQRASAAARTNGQNKNGERKEFFVMSLDLSSFSSSSFEIHCLWC